MADKAERETVLHGIYDARMRGDIDGILQHTTDDVQFSIAGCGASSAIPCSVTGTTALRDVLGQLIATLDFSNVRVLDLMVEDDRAVVHWRVDVRSRKSGDMAETEIVDVVRFAGDKVVSYRQVVDTALAARLLGS